MVKSADPVVTRSMLKEAVEDIASIIGDFSSQVDERFNSIDGRFQRVDERFDAIEAEIRQLNKKYDHLISTLDAFLKRLDDIETENTARDAHLARIDRWLHQLAEHTGVKLQ